jgi:flagellar hook-associated protein 3 FlgL
MRITQSETYRNFLSDIETLNESLNKSSRQVSSGKKLTTLQDSPAGSAELVSLTEQASRNDQYKSSVSDSAYFLKVADSVLNEVNNLATTVYTKGSQAASGSINSDVRDTLAEEIRSLRDQIVSLANTQARGRYIFSGSNVTVPAFTLNGDLPAYNGNDDISSVSVDDGMEVSQGVSGADAFNSIFSTINTLLTAIDGNDVAAIQTALSQFSSGLSGLSQARGKIGASLSALENVESNLAARATNLTERRSQIEDADMAQAAVQLKQIQTAMDASLTAAGSALSQRNLFDILG